MTSKKLKSDTVTINWNRCFEPHAIRSIEAIKRDGISAYGHIESGQFLDERTFDEERVYKPGELFIVTEQIACSNKYMKIAFMHNLVSIDAEGRRGFHIHEVAFDAKKHPYAENQLIAIILADPDLLSSVRLVK